jgi:hypothetical protein
MKTAIAIIQNIILPKLQKDSKFSEEKVDAAFWEKFATDLLHFEADAKPIYASIYSLELDNSEKIMDKLPNIYAQFLKELAESYVLGEPSQATDYLLKTNNASFAKEIDFLKIMQQAIKSVERKRIKADLPTSYERLSFELSETDLANVTKKKGREDLKEKMKQWDAELEEQESVPIVASSYTGYHNTMSKDVKKTKVISLSWMKYAVAACVVLATGIFFFRNTNQVVAPNYNTVVTTDAKKDSTQPQKNTPVKESIVLAEIETVSEKVIVQQSESMGFSSTEKPKITISYKDAKQRILSLEKYIATPSSTKEPATLSKYKSELNNLKKSNDKYIFDGKTLTLFSKFNPKQVAILVTDDQNYFLKKGSVYYNLKITKVPIPLEKVTNATTLEIVEKITFENE